MKDRYRIDNHKLMLHPHRVSNWLEAGDDWEKVKKVYPIYVEVSPIGACNHRCSFCALDYLGYKPTKLDINVMKTCFADMADHGVKSIMFAGEGEPLLHKRINQLVADAHRCNIDLALTSNGVLMDERFRDESLGLFSWIKISLDAGRENTYASIHGTGPQDFSKVVNNLRLCVKKKQKDKMDVIIGVQMLLLPENVEEIETAIKICRDDIGADYLVIKPYSQHIFSNSRKYEKFDYSNIKELEEKVSILSGENFSIVFRADTMAKTTGKREYDSCLSTPIFWSYIRSNGDVYSCSAYLGDTQFALGNLNSESFKEIWEGDRRRENLERVSKNLDIDGCRVNCRMDNVNRYLWELKHPGQHVNFI